jgi:hypothetical protein
MNDTNHTNCFLSLPLGGVELNGFFSSQLQTTQLLGATKSASHACAKRKKSMTDALGMIAI